MHMNQIETRDGVRIFITTNERGFGLSVFSRGLTATMSLTHSEARALAERIINSLDNYQLTETETQ